MQRSINKIRLLLCLLIFSGFVSASSSSAQNSTVKKEKPEHYNTEKYSHYGNQPFYQVAGKKYQVMPSAKGYEAEGIASWYGKPFHNRKTSSGEKYNMYELTAAHKTLPLPTYVKVTNLANGHEIIVRVNDRGPFHKNRLIDLSFAAAKALGFVLKGTTKVKIESLDDSREKAKYYAQAASYRSKKYADIFVEKLSKKFSFPVFVDNIDNTFYVKAGPFKTVDALENARAQLQSIGVKNIIYKMA